MRLVGTSHLATWIQPQPGWSATIAMTHLTCLTTELPGLSWFCPPAASPSSYLPSQLPKKAAPYARGARQVTPHPYPSPRRHLQVTPLRTRMGIRISGHTDFIDKTLEKSLWSHLLQDQPFFPLSEIKELS